MTTDYNYTELPPPHQFRSPRFAEANRAMFDEYVGLRILGASRVAALRAVWGEDVMTGGNTFAYLASLEANPYFRQKWDYEVKRVDLKKVWNPQVAAVELLQIVRDSNAKESARLGAIKELNVLAGITLTDESGKTKAGRSLDDFYKEQEEKKDGSSAPDVSEGVEPSPTTH